MNFDENQLHFCKGCPSYVEDLRKIIFVSRKMKIEELPKNLVEKFHLKLKEKTL
jgi:hypothetical protein